VSASDQSSESLVIDSLSHSSHLGFLYTLATGVFGDSVAHATQEGEALALGRHDGRFSQSLRPLPRSSSDGALTVRVVRA
jgi:hypothetical protein